FKDLNLGRYVQFVLPEAQIAVVKEDGKVLCINVDAKKTSQAISKFSQKDADTYLKLDQQYKSAINKILVPMFYTDPFSRTDAEESKFLESVPEGRFIMEARPKSVMQHAQETWESEEMKMIECLGPILTGIPFALPGGAISVTSLPLLKWTYVVKGGSGNFALAMRRTFVELGGTILESAHVDRVIVKNGEARGVLLADGREIIARKCVVSSVDVRQSFNKFIDQDALPDDWKTGLKKFTFDKTTDLGVHMALREEPKYNDKLRSWDPDVDRALRMYIGYNSMNDLLDEEREIRSGVYPKEVEKQRFEVLQPTKWDPSQAPAGRHTAFIWDFVKCEGNENIGEWDILGPQMTKLDKAQWRRFAPNMTEENIIDTSTFTPLDIQRSLINMIGGGLHMRWMEQAPRTLPSAKTPIKGYYYCGSGLYPGGSITMGPGYIAANVIAREEHVPMWWNPVVWGKEYPLLQ
ncbi:MAG: phytoene desaturase family protein, partial [Rhabdochlamydiaceae bacterium]